MNLNVISAKEAYDLFLKSPNFERKTKIEPQSFLSKTQYHIIKIEMHRRWRVFFLLMQLGLFFRGLNLATHNIIWMKSEEWKAQACWGPTFSLCNMYAVTGKHLRASLG